MATTAPARAAGGAARPTLEPPFTSGAWRTRMRPKMSATPLADSLVQFIQGGHSILIGSRDSRLLPECARGISARVERGGCEMTVFLPVATAAATLANLRDNGRIAVAFTHTDHHSVQVKGKVLAVGRAKPSDRDWIERYRFDLAHNWGVIGCPPRLTLRLAHWPCHAIRFRIESAFDQTPGPRAGGPLAEVVS